METGQKTCLDLKEKVEEYTADDGESVEEEEEEEGDEGEIEFGSKNGGIKKTKLAFGGGSGKRRSGGSSGGGGASPPCCQAENCAADLTEAKRYHRRHKVCELHSKATAVVVAGLRQRFCQQCSRFHELSEFDDTKRSCRSRLAGHNERRRKGSSEPTGQPRLGIQMNEDVAIPRIPNYKQFHFH